MKTVYDVIKKPIVTERSMADARERRYTFAVDKTANKVEIAKAVEELFNVTVKKVNTLNVKPKKKRVRYIAGYTRTWKKAMVTLAEGDTIELFAAN